MTRFYREARLRIRIRNKDFTGYIETIEITGLRVSFSIVKSLAWSTNSAVVKIYNLNANHRNLIKDYGDEVTLYAGYQLDGGPQVLFVGDTTAVYHVFEFPEIISVLECADGDKFINQLRVAVSFAENTSARDIITAIAIQMGIPYDPLPSTDNLVYRQGFEFVGMGKDALSIVCAKLNLQWSVQNQRLQVIPLNGTIVQQPITVNGHTGMIGIPQRYTYRRIDLYRALDAPLTGYKVNMNLTPRISPGSRIILESQALNNIRGDYRVENVRHDGDTFGFVWITQLETTELVGIR